MIKCVQYNGSGANLFGWSLFFRFPFFGSILLPLPIVNVIHKYTITISC